MEKCYFSFLVCGHYVQLTKRFQLKVLRQRRRAGQWINVLRFR